MVVWKLVDPIVHIHLTNETNTQIVHSMFIIFVKVYSIYLGLVLVFTLYLMSSLDLTLQSVLIYEFV